MQFKCPECNRTIYNRRVKTCEFCGNSLPSAFLYTEGDKKRLDKVYEDEHKKRMKKRAPLANPGGGISIDGLGDCGGE